MSKFLDIFYFFLCQFLYFLFRVEPKRIAACGYETALTILINPEPKDYHATIFGSYGVKVSTLDSLGYYRFGINPRNITKLGQMYHFYYNNEKILIGFTIIVPVDVT